MTVYGQHEVVKDLIARGSPRAARSCSRSSSVSVADLERKRGRRSGTAGRRGARDPLRLHRRMRRIPRRLPAGDSRRRADGLRERISVRLARHPGARRRPREELIYANHERGFALLSRCVPPRCAASICRSTRREHRQLARRADLVGIAGAARGRSRLAADRGPGPAEGDHAMRSFVVEPMHMAACFSPAMPRISCRRRAPRE